MPLSSPPSMFDAAALAPSYYEAGTAPRPVYPPLNGDIDCDVCVVGAGFLGLHTALSLTEAGREVCVLEASRIGHAASGRNGGQAIPELSCGLAALESQLGLEATQRIDQRIQDAARALGERIARYRIDCDYRASGHLVTAVLPRHVQELRRWAEESQKKYPRTSSDDALRFLDPNALRAYVQSPRYRAGLLDPMGAQLHPLKLTLGLARALTERGGKVHEGSAVHAVREDATAVELHHPQGRVRARQVVLATNVNTETVQGELPAQIARHILPVSSWIIATEPLSAEQAAACLPGDLPVADACHILDYFRLSADRRMLFGGRASYLGNMDPAYHTPRIRRRMCTVFPALAAVPIDYSWGGLIGITRTRAPLLGCSRFQPEHGGRGDGRIFHAQGFSGSGVVASLVAAQALCTAIQGDRGDLALFGRLRHRAFPGGRWLRAPLVAAGMLYYRMRDWV